MGTERTQTKFDPKKIENILRNAHTYLTDLFSTIALPTNNTNEDETKTEEDNDKKTLKKAPSVQNKTSRATSFVELQARIEKLTNKSDATYKDKLTKKNLKSRLKKKMKQEKRMSDGTQNRKIKQEKAKKGESIKAEDKSTEVTTEEKPEPATEEMGKMVFSKIDFAGLGKEKKKKGVKDPKKLLEKVQETKERVENLKSAGELEKAVKIAEKAAWRNALARAEGEKVKDDPILLKKTIKKNEQKKKASKKKWGVRKESVEKAQAEKQKKRDDNIEKRKKDKKLNKLKKAAKKGKVIPGF